MEFYCTPKYVYPYELKNITSSSNLCQKLLSSIPRRFPITVTSCEIVHRSSRSTIAVKASSSYINLAFFWKKEDPYGTRSLIKRSSQLLPPIIKKSLIKRFRMRAGACDRPKNTIRGPATWGPGKTRGRKRPATNAKNIFEIWRV